MDQTVFSCYAFVATFINGYQHVAPDHVKVVNNPLRPSDAYMRQLNNHNLFR